MSLPLWKTPQQFPIALIRKPTLVIAIKTLYVLTSASDKILIYNYSCLSLDLNQSKWLIYPPAPTFLLLWVLYMLNRTLYAQVIFGSQLLLHFILDGIFSGNLFLPWNSNLVVPPRCAPWPRSADSMKAGITSGFCLYRFTFVTSTDTFE